MAGILDILSGLGSDISSAFSDPDFQDKLAAASSLLSGNSNAPAQYHERAALRDLAAAAANAPANSAALDLSAPVTIPQPAPAPVSSSPLPPVGSPLPPAGSPNLPQIAAPSDLNMPTPQQVIANLGNMNLPVIPAGSPALPMVAPDQSAPAQASPTSPAPSSGGAPQSLYAQMLPQLLQAAAWSGDPTAVANLIQAGDKSKMGDWQQQQEQAYINSLPPDQRLIAQAIGGSAYAGWNKPETKEVSQGGTLVTVNPTTGHVINQMQGQQKPDSPATVDQQKAAIVQKIMTGQPLTAGEQQAADTLFPDHAWSEALTRIQRAKAAGQKPDPTDINIFNSRTHANITDEALGQVGYMDSNGNISYNLNGGSSPPPGSPPLPQQGQSGNGKTASTAVVVTSPAQAAQLPKGTWFVAPDGVRRQRK